MHIWILLHWRIHTNEHTLPAHSHPLKISVSLSCSFSDGLLHISSTLQQWRQFFRCSLGWIDAPIIAALRGTSWTTETGLHFKMYTHVFCSIQSTRFIDSSTANQNVFYSSFCFNGCSVAALLDVPQTKHLSITEQDELEGQFHQMALTSDLPVERWNENRIFVEAWCYVPFEVASGDTKKITAPKK